MNMCKAEEAVLCTEGHFVSVSSHHFCQKWPSPKDPRDHAPLTALHVTGQGRCSDRPFIVVAVLHSVLCEARAPES